MKKARRTTPAPFTAGPVIRHVLAIAALVGAAFLVYSNSFQAPLLLDNDEIILKDPRVHSTSADQMHRIFAGQYWETAPTGLYRPFTTLTYLFNYTILGSGPNPDGYHWFNFLLHASILAMLYGLGLAIFNDRRYAILLGLLWGLHPILTESVTNVVGRADLLAAFGVLAGLLCYRQAQSGTGAARALWLAGLTLAAAIGMFSKEGAIVLLGVMLLYDVAFPRAVSRAVRISAYALAAASCAIYLVVRARVLASTPFLPTQFGDNPLLEADFWIARATALKVMLHYFGLLLWPAKLSYDYSYNQVPLSGWTDPQTLAGLVLCLGALAAAVYRYRRNRAVFFGILFFFVTIAPVANIFLIIGTVMGERLLYLPSIGFAILIVCGIRAIPPRISSTAVNAAVAVVLVAFAARAWTRNADWLDQQRYWQSAVDAAPNSYKTNINAATSTFVFINQNDWNRAFGQVERALAILDPLPDSRNAPNAYRQAAIFYRSYGDHLATSAHNPEQWYRKALAALQRSERIELLWDQRYRAANAARGITVTSIPSKLYLEMGRIYLRLKDPRQAVAAFEKGRALESSPDLLEEAAAAYRAAGDPHGAARALVEAMAVDPSRGRLASQLVELYQQVDPTGCPVARDAAGVSLNVACPLVHNDICSASRNVAVNYDRHGQAFEAASIRRIAVNDLGCAADALR